MKPPVFVLGAPRSGTTLLYKMLISSGQFANYAAETHIFNMVWPKFGNLADAKSRLKALDAWLNSYQFSCSGLDPQEFSAAIKRACRSPGQFLRIFMQQVCELQGVDRWAECTPEHLLYIKDIKREFPYAKFIHIIRDGRDVALSEVVQGWVKPLPWDRLRRLEVSGLYWEWIVRKGRANGRTIAPDYMEIRFEELVGSPRTVLPGISSFIAQTLDYEWLLKNAVGELKNPNTSFKNNSEKFQPISRWKSKLGSHELQSLESTICPLLRELGYPLSGKNGSDNHTAQRLRTYYSLYFDSKLWLKSKTPLGRLASGPQSLNIETRLGPERSPH
jgi:hypothetical protein